MGWWINFQNPSMALVRLKWGCAALGKKINVPDIVPQQLAGIKDPCLLKILIYIYIVARDPSVEQ